jgi:hypothetical protein
VTVKELISELQKRDPESRVFMGYDGNVVVSESDSVVSPSEEEIEVCWWSVRPGDTVILCNE